MTNEKKPPVVNVGYYHTHKYHTIEPLHRKMNGTRRVLLFCILVVFMPAVLLIIPLYMKNTVYGKVFYRVTESDVLEIRDGLSNVFCSKHSLQMNDSFNAFQVSRRPETTSYRKHIRLKKSMSLPDDTLEYWGFYLLKGATVALSVCSRFQGASVLVVKGERELRTCGMLDHNKNKALTSGIYLPQADQQVKIYFESNAVEINSKENNYDANQTNATKVTEETATKANINRTVETNTKSTNKVIIENSTRSLRNIEQKDKPPLNKTNKVGDNNINYLEKNRMLEKKIKFLEEELRMNREDSGKEEDVEVLPTKKTLARNKRNNNPQEPPVILDQGIKHGGNNAAKNLTGGDDDSSISSFESGLFTCYNGYVLISQEFDPSELCLNISYLVNGKHMQTIHNVQEDGYYYYIFYSDNDIVSNDIHAIFDIYKPTLQYENVTKACINETKCTFNLEIFSKDRVIVEVPTRDGIDHEIDDEFLLISECHPRMEVYAIFPIAILAFILGCAFI